MTYDRSRDLLRMRMYLVCGADVHQMTTAADARSVATAKLLVGFLQSL